MTPVLAADIGGTNIRLARVDGAWVGDVTSVRTPAAQGGDAVIDALLTLVADATADRPVECLGIASAGVIDPHSGDVVAATDLIRGWAGTPLAAKVHQATGLDVRVMNDVHAHALGESRFGAGAGQPSMLLVAAGTGLGGGFVTSGELQRGVHGVAGHLGHVPSPEASGLMCSCGTVGHLECVASGSGLETLYAARAEAQTASAIAALASADDPWSTFCVTMSGTALGRAIGGWINTFDPGLVVVTGGLSLAGDLWWNALRAAAHAETLPTAISTPIVAATRPNQAALLGAASQFTPPPTAAP